MEFRKKHFVSIIKCGLVPLFPIRPLACRLRERITSFVDLYANRIQA